MRNVRRSKIGTLVALVSVAALSGGLAGCGGSKSAVAARADDIVAAVNAESASSGVNSKDVIRGIIGGPAGGNFKIGAKSLPGKGVVAGLEKGTLWVREGDTCYLVTGYPTKDAVAAPAACDATTAHVGS